MPIKGPPAGGYDAEHSAPAPLIVVAPNDVLQFKGPTKVEKSFEPNPELIKHVERLMTDAQSGKLMGLAYAIVHHDGLVPAGMIDSGFVHHGGCGFAMGEAISRLRRAWDKDRDQ